MSHAAYLKREEKERISQTKSIASTKALRQGCTWGVGEILRRPVRLEHRKQEGLEWGKKVRSAEPQHSWLCEPHRELLISFLVEQKSIKGF